MSAYHQLQDVNLVIMGLMQTIDAIPTQKGEEEGLIEEVYHLLEQVNARLQPYREPDEPNYHPHKRMEDC
jgi:hypothetical protein